MFPRRTTNFDSAIKTSAQMAILWLFCVLLTMSDHDYFIWASLIFPVKASSGSHYFLSLRLQAKHVYRFPVAVRPPSVLSFHDKQWHMTLKLIWEWLSMARYHTRGPPGGINITAWRTYCLSVYGRQEVKTRLGRCCVFFTALVTMVTKDLHLNAPA